MAKIKMTTWAKKLNKNGEPVIDKKTNDFIMKIVDECEVEDDVIEETLKEKKKRLLDEIQVKMNELNSLK